MDWNSIARGVNPGVYIWPAGFYLVRVWKVLRLRGDAKRARRVATALGMVLGVGTVAMGLYVFRAAPGIMLDVLALVISLAIAARATDPARN